MLTWKKATLTRLRSSGRTRACSYTSNAAIAATPDEVDPAHRDAQAEADEADDHRAVRDAPRAARRSGRRAVRDAVQAMTRGRTRRPGRRRSCRNPSPRRGRPAPAGPAAMQVAPQGDPRGDRRQHQGRPEPDVGQAREPLRVRVAAEPGSTGTERIKRPAIRQEQERRRPRTRAEQTTEKTRPPTRRRAARSGGAGSRSAGSARRSGDRPAG